MPSLVDTLDRLNASIKAIKVTARESATLPQRGPFSLSLFNPDIQKVIRDCDDTELGLFTFEDEPEVVAPDPHLGRKTAVEATPLRQRRVKTRESSAKPTEYEPEVYAEAALRILDKYQRTSTMPQAANEAVNILNRLEEVRSSIEEMQLQDTSSVKPVSPKSQANIEEKRVRELQDRAAKLKRRKEALLNNQSRKPPPALVESSPSPSVRRKSIPRPNRPRASNLPIRSFKAKVFKAAAPTPPSPMPAPATEDPMPHSDSFVSDTSSMGYVDLETPPPPEPPNRGERAEEDVNSGGTTTGDPSGSGDDGVVDMGREEVHVATPTRSPKKPTASLATVSPSLPEEPQVTTPKSAAPPLPTPPTPNLATPSGRKRAVKVTVEVENIAARIWSALGEALFPGKKPPRAKETIALLQNILTLPAAPSSPSTLSTTGSLDTELSSTTSTPLQILTAHILLTLLSTSGHTMPMQKLKESVAEKVKSEGRGLNEKDVTRALYNSIAKRLLAIDRSAAGQFVKFSL